MKAFLKTLFGDIRTVIAVAIIAGATLLLQAIGHPRLASVLIPVLTLGAVAVMVRK